MQKSAQITLILLIFGVIFTTIILVQLVGKPGVIDPGDNTDVQPVKSFVETCLQSQAESGLLFLGLQGGFNEPKDKQEYLTLSIPFYVRYNDTSMPTIEQFEQELNLFVEDNLEYCLNDFEGLSATGFAVLASEVPRAQAHVEEDAVRVQLDYPIEITQGATTHSIESFEALINFDFRNVYNEVNEIMEEQRKDPLAMHIGFLAKSAYDSNYFFEVIQLDEQTVIYSIKFDLKLKNEPYLYNFAARYDW